MAQQLIQLDQTCHPMSTMTQKWSTSRLFLNPKKSARPLKLRRKAKVTISNGKKGGGTCWQPHDLAKFAEWEVQQVVQRLWKIFCILHSKVMRFYHHHHHNYPSEFYLLFFNDRYLLKIGNKATNYGLEKEAEAKQCFERRYQLIVCDSGLLIDEEYPFLGVSPDGLIGTDCCIEIKCPHSAETMTPLEAVQAGKVIALSNLYVLFIWNMKYLSKMIPNLIFIKTKWRNTFFFSDKILYSGKWQTCPEKNRQVLLPGARVTWHFEEEKMFLHRVDASRHVCWGNLLWTRFLGWNERKISTILPFRSTSRNRGFKERKRLAAEEIKCNCSSQNNFNLLHPKQLTMYIVGLIMCTSGRLSPRNESFMQKRH